MLDLINPVIAAVRTDGEFAEAVKANVSAVFMLKADVLTLPALARGKGAKKIYVHIDTAEGIGKDKKGAGISEKLRRGRHHQHEKPYDRPR